MKYCYLLCILSFLSCKTEPGPKSFKMADNVVVAHRGAWKAKDLPENSIAALRHAIELNCSGSEFDVRMTADDVLIVTHDPTYHEMVVEESTYDELNTIKLSNGEDVPTLKATLEAGLTNNPGTGMVLELKPSKTKERGQIIATKAVELVRTLKAEHIMASYISFDYDMLLKVVELDPTAKTQYLDGSKAPDVVKADKISGLDYFMSVFKHNLGWIQSAKDLGITLNVWTVNKEEDLDWFLEQDFDFITTNEPELLFERIALRQK